MAKFVYRMQSILNMKEKLKEQAKNEFAKARAQLNIEEEKLEQLKKRKLSYEENGRSLLDGGLKVSTILENGRAIEQMQSLITEQMRQVDLASKALERARKKLEEAMQESKIQEKLRENAFEEFLREENARESREIDELVSYTYGQRRKQENAR